MTKDKEKEKETRAKKTKKKLLKPARVMESIIHLQSKTHQKMITKTHIIDIKGKKFIKQHEIEKDKEYAVVTKPSKKHFKARKNNKG